MVSQSINHWIYHSLSKLLLDYSTSIFFNYLQRGYTYVADWKVSLEEGKPHEIKDHTIETFEKQLQETIDYVGEYVRLYQVHSATFESGILSNKVVHQALHQCKQERGWKIGLSVSSPKQNEVIREAMKIMVSGERLFDSVQCTYNLLEQKPGEALLEASEAGMDIIIKEGLANGRVLQHPLLQEMIDRESKLSDIGTTVDQLALAAILVQPFQPRVLSGAVTVDHYDSNMKAVQIAEVLKENPHLLKELMQGCKISR